MANRNNSTASPPDWLSVTEKDLSDGTSPLGMLRSKALSYFDALTRNFVGNSNLFQVNLGQFHQNFVVTTGNTSKVRVLHSLFSANANPELTTSDTVVLGVFGVNRTAPFKTLTAASAVLALNAPPTRGKKDTEPLLPSIQQFTDVRNKKEFADLVGDAQGMLETGNLIEFPSAHFIHPQVFVDIEGKREWEASRLGYKIITLYRYEGDDDDKEEKEEGPEDEEDKRPRSIQGVYQLLNLLTL
jgi:hypothetical protein